MTTEQQDNLLQKVIIHHAVLHEVDTAHYEQGADTLKKEHQEAMDSSLNETYEALDSQQKPMINNLDKHYKEWIELTKPIKLKLLITSYVITKHELKIQELVNQGKDKLGITIEEQVNLNIALVNVFQASLGNNKDASPRSALTYLEKAATKIQAKVHVRKQVEVRKTKIKSATLIQTMSRGVLARRANKKIAETETEAKPVGRRLTTPGT